LTDLNELFDEEVTPPNGYFVVAESPDAQPPIDHRRIDRRVLLVCLVAIIIFAFTGFILVSLAASGQPGASGQFNAENSSAAIATTTSEQTSAALPNTVVPAATPVPTTEPPPVPTPTTQPTPTPSPTTSTTTEPPPNLCGAPANPYGYNFCGGTLIYTPAADICSYLVCAANFWKADGYVVLCQDNTFSRTGGKPKVCNQDRGYRRALFA
jgi:hypothetical protein